MAGIGASLKVIDTDKQLVRYMMQDVTNELNKRLTKHIGRIKERLQLATFNYLQTTDTYQSLVHGNLAVHFGIPSVNREANINKILQSVVDHMRVEFKPIKYRTSKFINGIKIKVLLKDLSEVLNLAVGVVFTEEGEELEWLKWLLTKGDSIIIKEYDVEFSPGEGRSGGGIMVAEKSAAWRVPPQYSGTMRNNWLTRALNKNAAAYFSIIENVIKSELQGI